jgi:hypothetical protein
MEAVVAICGSDDVVVMAKLAVVISSVERVAGSVGAGSELVMEPGALVWDSEGGLELVVLRLPGKILVSTGLVDVSGGSVVTSADDSTEGEVELKVAVEISDNVEAIDVGKSSAKEEVAIGVGRHSPKLNGCGP